ncbi:hypothetical protein Tco_0733465 [Tanacetum coccineum]
MEPTTRITATGNNDDGVNDRLRQFIRLNGENVSWNVYKTGILQRFGMVYDDPVSEIRKLKYQINAKEYQDALDTLLSSDVSLLVHCPSPYQWNKNVLVDTKNFLELIWIRRIGPPGYGVSDLLDMAYRTYWVRRIELLRYGVLGSLGTHIGLLRYGVLYILGTAYRASWVRIGQWSFDSSKSWIRRIGLE